MLNQRIKKLIKPVAIATIFLIIFLDLPFICKSHSHHHEHSHESPAHKYSKEANLHVPPAGPATPPQVNVTQNIWLYAISSTLLISIAPFLILFFIPLDGTEKKKPLLNILLAFASGGLLGDAFLHLIPHANVANAHNHGGHGHSHAAGADHEPHDLSIGLWVLAGIISFLAIEKGVRMIKGGHGHSHAETSKSKDKKSPKGEKSETEESKPFAVAGYLNLAADFSHNFTDGLAIGK